MKNDNDDDDDDDVKGWGVGRSAVGGKTVYGSIIDGDNEEHRTRMGARRRQQEEEELQLWPWLMMEGKWRG